MYADDGIYDRTQMYMVRKVRTTEAIYWTTDEFATVWGTTPRNVTAWCRRQLIPGVEKVGTQWRIPRDAQPPVFERKGLPPIMRRWWDDLPNKAESVLAVRAFTHQVRAATGMAALDSGFHYGPPEQMVIDSISAHDVEVASAAKGYAEMTEEVSTKATGEDGWIKTMPTGYGWVRTVEGMVSKEVRAKAHELIEALRPYSTL